MSYTQIDYEVIGAVARIWQNRPKKANAQSSQLLDELDHALQTAQKDETIHTIIIAGRGKHFSSGHDIKEGMQRPNITEDRWRYEEQHYLQYAMRIWDCPKPTIAQVNGACIAGGFFVANMCDLVVAADDAYFADPVCHSFAAAATEILIHPWVMGLRAAKEFLYTGEALSASAAHRMGMVNRVVSTDALASETLALAQKIAEAPPFGLQLTKRSLNRTADMQGFRAALNAHFDTHQLSHTSNEFSEKLEQ